jgi:hypothetical protein
MPLHLRGPLTCLKASTATALVLFLDLIFPFLTILYILFLKVTNNLTKKYITDFSPIIKLVFYTSSNKKAPRLLSFPDNPWGLKLFAHILAFG